MSDAPDFYRFVQCTNQPCQLRFPGVESVACPRCMHPTRLVSERHQPAPARVDDDKHQHLSLLLDNIRSVFNVGSIFRSADGCGVRSIYLCGITATPAHASMKKTALGAEEVVPWSHHRNAVALAEQLAHEGHTLWALEYTADSTNLLTPQPHAEKRVLVVGNEVTGVDPGVLALCSRTLHIPMRGSKDSLNVASAAAIAGYALCAQDSPC